MLQLILIGLIVFGSHVISMVTGFGANVLGLPVLALVVGFVVAKQSMVVLGVLLYAYMTLRCRSQINMSELRKILLIAAPGLLVGILICELLPARASMTLLGLFVVAVALRGLIIAAPAAAATAAASSTWAGRIMLFLGGLVHGAFTTGGPLLVVYCRRALPDKSTFRATLGAMWLLFGVGLMAEWTLAGAWDVQSLRLTLLSLPFLIAGMIGGEYLHHRVDARTFATAVHLTLLVTGGVLCWSALR